VRVTIGERLGLLPKASKVQPEKHTGEDVEPLRFAPEGPVLRLADCPSSLSPFGQSARRRTTEDAI